MIYMRAALRQRMRKRLGRKKAGKLYTPTSVIKRKIKRALRAKTLRVEAK
jgi:hypothetical protein